VLESAGAIAGAAGLGDGAEGNEPQDRTEQGDEPVGAGTSQARSEHCWRARTAPEQPAWIALPLGPTRPRKTRTET
jgi:hypothetical protein